MASKRSNPEQVLSQNYKERPIPSQKTSVQQVSSLQKVARIMNIINQNIKSFSCIKFN